jgi:hypothetical protein
MVLFLLAVHMAWPAGDSLLSPPLATAALTHSLLLRAGVERNPGPKMLRLHNPGGKLCYGNAGTNFLFSAPDVTQFLAQQPTDGQLINIIRSLITASPDEVKSRTM